MTERISVIIPIYNVKDCLRRCLDAVRNQTYRNLEVILVDDGATDGSGGICDEYVNLDDRFQVIHKQNGGTSSARNAGIEAATGEFLGFLDADDWPEKDLYETLYQAFETKPEAVAAQMMSRNFYPDGSLAQGPLKTSGKTVFLSKEEYFRELILHVGDSSFCTKLIRRDFMKAYRFQEKKLNEDFELLLRMIPNMDGILTVEKVGYNIELSVSSNTRGRFKENLYLDMMENAEKAVEVTKQYFPQFLIEAKRFILVQSLDYMLHVPVEQMTGSNPFYQQEKKRLKMSREEIKNNPYFDAQQRRNLKILSSFPPRMVRSLHGIWMKIKKSGNER